MRNEYEWFLWIDNEMIMKIMSDDWGETQQKWVMRRWDGFSEIMREIRTNEWNEKKTKSEKCIN